MSAVLDDPLMAALCVICRAEAMEPRDEGIAFKVPTPDFPDEHCWALVTWDEFDSLVKDKKWVDLIGQDEFEPSADGKYWFTRWDEREEKKQRRKGPKRTFRRLKWRGTRSLIRRRSDGAPKEADAAEAEARGDVRRDDQRAPAHRPEGGRPVDVLVRVLAGPG